METSKAVTIKCRKVFERVNDYRKSGILCDVNLVIDNKIFPAHKVILAGFSPFFEAMFTGDFHEAQENTVTLDAIDVNVMETLLEYAYTDNITITISNAESLFHATSFLQVEDIFKLAGKVLEDNLNAANCMRIYRLAEIYSCRRLRKEARSFILKCFPAVCSSVEFYQLEAKAVIDIIDDDSLLVAKEEVVFDAVLRWFKFDEYNRKADLTQVLSHVRLAYMDPNFLWSRVRLTKALQQTASVVTLFEEVKWYYLAQNRKNEIYSSFTKRRNSSLDMEVTTFLTLFCSSCCDKLKSALIYHNDLGQNAENSLKLNISKTAGDETFKLHSRVKVLMCYGKCLETNNKRLLLVTEVGEVVGELPSCNAMYWWSAVNYQMHLLCGDDCRTVKYFDFEAKEWKTATRLNRRFEGRSLILNVDGIWYSFGDKSVLRDNGPHRYNAESNVWEKIAPLSGVAADVVTLYGMIYVVGEASGKTEPNRIHSYDPGTDLWTQVTSLPTSSKKPRVCGFNGCIYVFSGAGVFLEEEEPSTRRVDVYNLTTGEWKRCADIPNNLHPSYMTKPVVLGGQIYALTKPFQDSTDRGKVLVYSPTSDTWEDFPFWEERFEITNVQGPLLIKRPPET